MVSVTGELRSLVRVQDVYEEFGTPVDTAIGQIQIERRLAATYLGTSRRRQGFGAQGAEGVSVRASLP
ncbi:hypothetical protein [Streptomyces sp. NBC_00078]|uniref:hypothetical protein n=1 Tax=unclassified Streptomyces TaxID=2593676 RepID=UPI0022531929|nr:hypothetical protein [Streptomyces sp. NBC_00078]MCX5419424.1 hypothetical protein [Streptomyces sp. NBC_00078]